MPDSCFSVILFTAPPIGASVEDGGALIKIDGRETLLRTVELFLNRDNVNQITVAFHPDSIDEAKARFGGHFGFTGVKIVSGGPGWLDQITTASEKLPDDSTHVIVHDAARPCVPFGDIDAVLELSQRHAAIVTTTPAQAGLIELDEGDEPLAIESHRRFAALVTPFVFRRDVFDEICRSKTVPRASTLKTTRGSPLNMRVNGSGDAAIVKSMLQLLPKPKAKASSPFEEAQW